MQNHRYRQGSRGFSFVELLVTVAVTALVFGGIMASVQFALKVISTTKAKTGALALATEKIEYIRSLTYSDAGTVAGIPSGLIPQNSTTTLNGVLYHERVLIQYVDSPDDGTGGSDTNGILADYKEVKVEYSWLTREGTSTVYFLTNIVPPGIESTTGGGTLTVNVFDADVLPVSGAQVRLYNDTTTSTIDTTRNSNVDGVAMFAGAPAAANYQITVTKAGYSTDQTYSVTVANPSPVTTHVAVLEGAVSTMNFQIDELSDLTVLTVGPSTNGTFDDDFTDAGLTAEMTNTSIGSSNVILSGGAGAYVPSGTVTSTTTAPSTITSWDVANWLATVPANTEVVVQIYSVDGGGVRTLIPDSDLPGNSIGFTTGPINLGGLSVGTYSSLAIGATLTSSDVNVTPELLSWHIDHVITLPSIASIPFTLTGAKVIGTGPVYKYTDSHTTDGGGDVLIQDLEWDAYNVTLDTGAYDISEACPNIPYALAPGVNDSLQLTLVPSSAQSLRVSVVDVNGAPISGATVTLSRPGLNEVLTSSTCGQVFFNSGLPSEIDYQVEVEATGYTDNTVTDIIIDSADSLTVILST
jgi:hypothetical protein